MSSSIHVSPSSLNLTLLTLYRIHWVPPEGLHAVCFSSLVWSSPGVVLTQATAEMPPLQGAFSHQPWIQFAIFGSTKYLGLWLDLSHSAHVSDFLPQTPLFAMLGMELGILSPFCLFLILLFFFWGGVAGPRQCQWTSFPSALHMGVSRRAAVLIVGL